MDLPKADSGGPGFPGPINLGNPVEFTIKQLAQKVIEMTGSSSKLIYQPLPSDDPTQRKPNIKRAKEILNNWEPKFNLDQGLMKTIAYFDQILRFE